MAAVALVALALALWLGVDGMRRLGRWSSRLAGPWRPGVAGGALIALFGGAGLMARGAVGEGAALLGLAGGLCLLARLRRERAQSAPSAQQRWDMSEAEARGMLGVDDQAGPEEIERAYKRLMMRVHPDLGGADGLAAQLNAARKVLLKDARRGAA